MIERHFNADHINRIINHPSYAELGLSIPSNMECIYAYHPDIVVLCDKWGFLAAAPIGNGVYDVHAGVLPIGRGQWCRNAAKEAIGYLFEKSDATCLLFRCPVGNLRASSGARMLGAKFHSTASITMPKLPAPVPCSVYILTIGRWLELTGRGN